ncbi:MAG: hypothetical protein SWX82_15330 [Cyanobacteriota bacterium]|nr:hypothetical protein [Cyanobacteriota bacterium]
MSWVNPVVRSLLLTHLTAVARLVPQRVLVRYAGAEIIYLLIDCSPANAPYTIGDRTAFYIERWLWC